MAVAITPGRSSGSFSPTAISTWTTCHRKYSYRYAERLETDGPMSPSRLLGLVLHSALAWLYAQAPPERSVALAHGAARHWWAIERRDGVFTDRDEEALWGRRALDALSWYCGSYDMRTRPLLTEEWVRATLPNQHVVAGRVDRVGLAEDGAALEIVDYKSGACRIAEGALGEDTAAQVYALAAARTLRRPVARVTFVYLCEQVERTWEPSGAVMAGVEERLVELSDEIACAERFDPSPGPHCRVCDFRRSCPAAAPTAATLDTTSVVF